ncbi:MAG: phospholipid carrier-dependent glycosyltransferase, partial [Acidobacteriota bacterium]
MEQSLPPENASLRPRQAWRAHAALLGLLVLLNVAVKITLWVQPPQTFPDSLGYIAPAMRLLDGLGYGSQENGFRTPTYPLFIATILLPFNHADLSGCREARVPACLGEAQQEPGAQANLRAIAAVQVLLGTLTILLVYWFAWRISYHAWVAALCAFTYPIDLSTGYWEISVLTDTLTTFLLMLAVCLTLLVADARRHRVALHVALGGVLGALALCHSVYLLYAIVPAAFLWLRHRQIDTQTGSNDYSRYPLSLSLVLVIPAALVLAWSVRNYQVDGYFTPSAISGYNLTQMVGPFMEQAPPLYRDLASIYLDYRADRIAVR